MRRPYMNRVGLDVIVDVRQVVREQTFDLAE